ncbi:hypothetical protein N0V88_000608 [Collariella sp. IMI 366227]|nr:hypothetical protein N0V88_000608 [Collariella sp. IMI 366227]
MQLKPSLALATLPGPGHSNRLQDLLATSTAYAPDQQETPSSSATLILDEDTTTIDPAFPLPTTTETTTDYDDTDYPTQSPLPSSSSFTDSLLPQPSHTTGIYPQPSNGTIVTVSTSSSAEEPATVTETAAEPESTEHNDEPTQSSDDSNEDDDTRPTGFFADADIG